VVTYASRSCNRAEQNYSSYEGELLAVVWAVLSLRHHLDGVHFTLITDHQPLKWVMGNTDLRGKLWRWVQLLSSFDFDVVHRPGVLQQHADGLSRNPQPTTCDQTAASEQEAAWPAELIAAFTAGVELEEPEQGPPRLSKYLAQMQEPAAPEATDTPAAWYAGQAEEPLDPYAHPDLLAWLQQGASTALGEAWPQATRAQLLWHANMIWRQEPHGRTRVVPPEERTTLIQHTHDQHGHFGERGTYAQLRNQYWWPGSGRTPGTWCASARPATGSRARCGRASARCRACPSRE